MNETQNTNQNTEQARRPWAIAGFIFMIIVLAWLSVQLVNVLPSAFSSLASLAEGVNQYKESIASGRDEVELDVTSNTDIVNAGATVDIEWTAAETAGNYTFSYICTDGVAVAILAADGQTPVSCENSYNIGEDTALTLLVESEKDRYAEVAYTIAFLGNNDREPHSTDTKVFTVINNTIPEAGDTEVAIETPELPTPTPEPETPTPTTPVRPTQPTNPEPETTYTYTYEIPESDPSGFTDLGVSMVGVGRIVGDTFFAGQIAQNETGAVQFVVRNYGTKTSEDWSYEIALPNGVSYEANNQAPLKPNEAATITVGFKTDDDDSHQFTVRIATDADTASINNVARMSVSIVE